MVISEWQKVKYRSQFIDIVNHHIKAKTDNRKYPKVKSGYRLPTSEKHHVNSLQCFLGEVKELEEQYCHEDFQGSPTKSICRLSIIHWPVYSTRQNFIRRENERDIKQGLFSFKMWIINSGSVCCSETIKLKIPHKNVKYSLPTFLLRTTSNPRELNH